MYFKNDDLFPQKHTANVTGETFKLKRNSDVPLRGRRYDEKSDCVWVI